MCACVCVCVCVCADRRIDARHIGENKSLMLTVMAPLMSSDSIDWEEITPWVDERGRERGREREIGREIEIERERERGKGAGNTE